ncbi:Ankyrin-1 [Lecanosticta acicola]|uniref:Ankyrin-1 n=1 Tax=Lecanosticta acicola TaxID=111012 RepID=A0AAI8YZ82_9PEZI|nr:Ankyrin-1 [Lecanosticta acicola]
MTSLGSTSLHFAARYGNNGMVDLLLRLPIDMDVAYSDRKTALAEAVKGNHVETVRLLLQYRLVGDDEYYEHYDYMYIAYEKKNCVVARLLIEDEASYGANQGLTEAARCNQVDFMRFLIDNGADADRPYNGWRNTPLCTAVHFRKIEAARLLLARGASANGWPGEYGETPLMSIYGSPADQEKALIKLLIDSGASINLSRPRFDGGRKAFTALSSACLEAMDWVIEELLKYGADPNLGWPTALERAIDGICGTNIVKLLLDAGARLDLVSQRCFAKLRSLASSDFEKIDWEEEDIREPREKLELLRLHAPGGQL